MSAKVKWLNREQQQVWRSYLLGVARINEYLDADLREHGLDVAEYEILVVLSEAPDWRMRMSQLAGMVHQSRSRLTHAIARLEKENIVVRSSAEHDRRGVYAQLTDHGYSVLDAAAPSHVAAVRRILVDACAPEDFAAMGRVMKAVLAVED